MLLGFRMHCGFVFMPHIWLFFDVLIHAVVDVAGYAGELYDEGPVFLLPDGLRSIPRAV